MAPGASADTGNAPSVNDVAVGDSQEDLEHCFWDAARRLTFQFKFKIHFPLFSGEQLEVGADGGTVGPAPQPPSLHDDRAALGHAHARAVRGSLNLLTMTMFACLVNLNDRHVNARDVFNFALHKRGPTARTR